MELEHMIFFPFSIQIQLRAYHRYRCRLYINDAIVNFTIFAMVHTITRLQFAAFKYDAKFADIIVSR